MGCKCSSWVVAFWFMWSGLVAKSPPERGASYEGDREWSADVPANAGRVDGAVQQGQVPFLLRAPVQPSKANVYRANRDVARAGMLSWGRHPTDSDVHGKSSCGLVSKSAIGLLRTR